MDKIFSVFYKDILSPGSNIQNKIKVPDDTYQGEFFGFITERQLNIYFLHIFEENETIY